MICYHGTTQEGLVNILSSSGIKKITPWTVSDDDGCMYVWPQDKIITANMLEGEDLECIEDACMQAAGISARIQAATSGEEDIIILVLDIPDTLLQDDYSCDNMPTSASLILCNDFNKDFIAKVYSAECSKYLHPFVISGLLDNPYINLVDVDTDLLSAARAIREADVYFEPLEEIEYLEEKDLVTKLC